MNDVKNTKLCRDVERTIYLIGQKRTNSHKLPTNSPVP